MKWGRLFARMLKQDRDLRRDFEEWIKELRAEFSHELESAAGELPVYRTQGKIFGLDVLISMLEQAMNLPADETTSDGHS